MPPKKEEEPVQQSVQVDCPLEEAFELFTDHCGQWWPMAEHFEIEPWKGGKVLERTRSDGERELGTVTIWDPPHRVAFTWNSREDESVDVVFSPEDGGTRVTLTHHGWQNEGVEFACMASFAEFAVHQLMAIA